MLTFLINESINFKLLIICYLSLYLDIPDPVIIITSTGSGNISDNYTLMCSIDNLDDLLNIQLNITFLRITDGGYEVLSYEESSEDSIITVHFTPLRTSDSGRYRCSVDIRQIVIDYQDVFYESFTINTTSEYDMCIIGIGTKGAPPNNYRYLFPPNPVYKVIHSPINTPPPPPHTSNSCHTPFFYSLM